MKSRFLDIKNCHALLPKGNVGKIVQKLELCLAGVNDAAMLNNKPNLSRHCVDNMIEHNIKTKDKQKGRWKRNYPSDLEIAVALNYYDDSIHVQAVEANPPIFQMALLHIIYESDSGSVWKIILPLQFLLKGWGDANSGYQGYVHTISHNLPKGMTPKERSKRNDRADDYTYVGITGRNWIQRFSEHMKETKRECRYRFHKAIRDALNMENVLFNSWLEDINMTYEEAMNWEEIEVDKIASDWNGLNMIPGGFKGLKELHKHRLIKSLHISLEERDNAICKYIKEHPRKGIPNPFISQLWEDDEYYLRINEANPKRLSPDQVRQIRLLSKEGWSESDITIKVGALNERQVKDVLSGRAYSRID
jgi:hypothetical protein